MTVADFRRIALSFPNAEESSHFGAADFRIGGHIFATLAHIERGYGNLMLNPELQAGFLADAPGIFVAVKGGWGRSGATHIILAKANKAVLTGALQTAYNLRLAKNTKPAKKKPLHKTT